MVERDQIFLSNAFGLSNLAEGLACFHYQSFGRNLAQTILAAIAMATGAVVGEEPRPLGERVFAEQRSSAAERDAFGIGELLDPLGVAVGGLDGHLVFRFAPVGSEGQPGEQANSRKQGEHKTEIEAVS